MNEIISTLVTFFSFSSIGASEEIFSLNFLMKGGVFYLAIIWLACVIWVIKDITNRSDSLILQVISILLVTGLTPIFGLPIYFLIRPSTTLFERYYEQTSLLALEGSGDQINIPEAIEINKCRSCNGVINSDDSFCPNCGIELLDSCKGCGAKLQFEWKFCNSCGKKREEKKIEEIEGIKGSTEKISLENEIIQKENTELVKMGK